MSLGQFQVLIVLGVFTYLFIYLPSYIAVLLSSLKIVQLRHAVTEHAIKGMETAENCGLSCCTLDWLINDMICMEFNMPRQFHWDFPFNLQDENK